MKKIKLNLKSNIQILSRAELRKVSGGTFVPCQAECISDTDCPITEAGIRGWCQMTKVGECHNKDGSLQPPLGFCVF